jgi:hypothetical protein
MALIKKIGLSAAVSVLASGKGCNAGSGCFSIYSPPDLDLIVVHCRESKYV